jgi:hypothetical protein
MGLSMTLPVSAPAMVDFSPGRWFIGVLDLPPDGVRAARFDP